MKNFKIFYEAKRGPNSENSAIISQDLSTIRRDRENYLKLKADIESGVNKRAAFQKHFPNLQYIDHSLPVEVVGVRVQKMSNQLGFKFSGYLSNTSDSSQGGKGRSGGSKQAIEAFMSDNRLSISYDLFVNLGYLDEFVDLYTYKTKSSAVDAVRKFVRQYYKHTGIKLVTQYYKDSSIRVYENIVENYLDEFLTEMKEEMYKEEYDSMLDWFFTFCKNHNIYLSPTSLRITNHFYRMRKFVKSAKYDIDIPIMPRGNRAFKNPGKKPRTNELGTPGNFPKQFRQITPPNSSSTPPSNYKHGGNAPKDNNFPST
jgi:hypothetical protein